VVEDIVGMDRREKRLSDQYPGSRPTVLQNALAIELSHVASSSDVPSALSSFAKRKSSLCCSENLLQLLTGVDVSFVVVLERDPLVLCEAGSGHRVGMQRGPLLTANCCLQGPLVLVGHGVVYLVGLWRSWWCLNKALQ
jgi:hypothetical protein